MAEPKRHPVPEEMTEMNPRGEYTRNEEITLATSGLPAIPPCRHRREASPPLGPSTMPLHSTGLTEASYIDSHLSTDAILQLVTVSRSQKLGTKWGQHWPCIPTQLQCICNVASFHPLTTEDFATLLQCFRNVRSMSRGATQNPVATQMQCKSNIARAARSR